MSVEDFAIWSRWWPTVREGTVALYFDVGLGLPDEIPATDDANQLLGWVRNNQKRADVLIEREDAVWLVELRFRAQSSALGRLKTYDALLLQDNPFTKPVRLFLVTDRRDSEVGLVAAMLGINYVVA